MGVTIVASSADDGVSFFYAPDGTCACNYYSGSNYYTAPTSGTWSGLGYFPSFPASCPYVTAVGATMGPEVGQPEVACQSQLGGLITSGGGFSAYYSTPSWQKDVVLPFLSQTTASSGYNPNGRGYPDVSLIGVSYEVVIDNMINYMYGTSCSSPVFGAMITLINSARMEKNMSSVGFVNPTLYHHANASLFNDITSGVNNCCMQRAAGDPQCCSAGFEATVGWDPVTGLGSIDYPVLAGFFDVTVESSSNSSHNILAIVLGCIFGAFFLCGLGFAYMYHLRTKKSNPLLTNNNTKSEVELDSNNPMAQSFSSP